jgi:hypothetical protein
MMGPGVRLDIDRLRSGHVNIHGFEMITAWQYRGPTDWLNKLYYMYDDGCRDIKLYNVSDNFVPSDFERGIALAPLIVRSDEPNIHNIAKRSRKRHAVGFSVDLSFEFNPPDGNQAVPVALDEYKHYYSYVDRYLDLGVCSFQGMLIRDITETNRVKSLEIQIVHKPVFSDQEPHTIKESRYSEDRGVMSGGKPRDSFSVFDEKSKYSGIKTSGHTEGFQVEIVVD